MRSWFSPGTDRASGEWVKSWDSFIHSWITIESPKVNPANRSASDTNDTFWTQSDSCNVWCMCQEIRSVVNCSSYILYYCLSAFLLWSSEFVSLLAIEYDRSCGGFTIKHHINFTNCWIDASIQNTIACTNETRTGEHQLWKTKDKSQTTAFLAFYSSINQSIN